MKSILSVFTLAMLSVLAIADDPKLKMDGTWEMSKGVMGGNDLPAEMLKTIKLKISGNDYEVTMGEEKIKGSGLPDETTTPKRIKLKDKEGPNADKTIYAIYELNKDEMKVCYAMEGNEYPKEFKSPKESKFFLAVYKRVK